MGKKNIGHKSYLAELDKGIFENTYETNVIIMTQCSKGLCVHGSCTGQCDQMDFGCQYCQRNENNGRMGWLSHANLKVF